MVDCAATVVVELLVGSELVADAVGTTVTTCGVALMALPSCVVAVVDVVAAVCSALWVVVIPRMPSARLSIGDKMSRA